MKYCPNCQQQLPDDAMFCDSCGTLQPTSPAHQQPEDVFSFVTPQQSQRTSNPASTVPSFTPPQSSNNIQPTSPTPTFVPPQTKTNNGAPSVPPVFTPPKAPTFTPPVKTFSPPAFNGPACHFHRDEPAVTKCARCGKYLCQDCLDSYGVEAGEYAGHALCYDCTQELVADNVKELKKQKAKIMVLFVATLIGMVFGALFFEESALAGFICMFWFGSFWNWIKSTVSGWWNNPAGRSWAGLIGAGIGALIVAPYFTIKKIVQCIVFLSRTSKSIQTDSDALHQMSEYMEYTMVRNQNRGVDIETLLNDNSQLANNSVAQMARTQTEEQIEAHIRGCLATINENGEIIRNFAA